MIYEIIRKIKSNGIKSNLPAELKQNLEISNIFNVIDIVLVFPFIILFRESPIASMLTAVTILAHLTSFMLVRYHQYNIGRFIYSITTATTVYFVAALIYTDDGTDGMAAKFLILGAIIMPFIVFTKKEWKFTLLALSVDLGYIISFNYLNNLLDLPNIHNVDTPALRLLSILTTFIIFCSIFFYYKNLIIKQNLKLDQSNKELMVKNKELEELNATKNKFFSIVAHDLRSPFNTILGFTKILQKNHHAFNSEELESFSNSFYTAAVNTHKTVENLLSWSRSQLNCLKITPTSIELQDFVSEIVSRQQEIARKKEINLKNKIGKGIYVDADKNICGLVLRNLISNAIKFSFRKGVVTISALSLQRNHTSYVEICVEDSGVGMNPDALTKLFKIENANSRAGTENEQGTGLGLLLCKEFVEKHGGVIRVESELGSGSKFYFTLPALESNVHNNFSFASSNNIECLV